MKDGRVGTLPQTLRKSLSAIERCESELRDKSDQGEYYPVQVVIGKLRQWIEKFIPLTDPVDLLLALSLDHLRHRRYLLALTTSWEAVRNFQSEVTQLPLTKENWENRSVRNEFNKQLKTVPPSLRRRFQQTCLKPPKSLQIIRNQVVHCLGPTQTEHVRADELKGLVTKLVRGTSDVIDDMRKAGLKRQAIENGSG
jgi:hypothetical protein